MQSTKEPEEGAKDHRRFTNNRWVLVQVPVLLVAAGCRLVAWQGVAQQRGFQGRVGSMLLARAARVWKVARMAWMR